MSTETSKHAPLFAELWRGTGPTGRCVEVLEVAVEDYGGNEHGRATTARGVRRIQNSLRIQTRLRPLRVGGPVAAGGIDCGPWLPSHPTMDGQAAGG